MLNCGNTAANMFKALADFLEKHNLSIQDCQGQSFDNASYMSENQALVQKKQSGSLVAIPLILLGKLQPNGVQPQCHVSH